MKESTTKKSRPLNVYVARNSSAEKRFRSTAGIPGLQPEEIAPGLTPSPQHDLHFQGGKTISNLIFHNFYVGGQQAWNPNDIQSIDQALSSAMSDQDLNNVMVQYFSTGTITSQLNRSETLDGPPPAVMSQYDVETLLGNLYTQGKLTGFDLTSTLFNFMLPSGTVLNTNTTPGNLITAQQKKPVQHKLHHRPIIPHDDADSLNGLGGYHGSIHMGSDTVYYAVGVYSETLADGTVNGIPVFDQSWKNVVGTFYHELNEARTDADVEDAIRAGNDPNATKFLGWISNQGEECGDYPVFEASNALTLVFQEVPLTNGNGTVPIQFQYSNAVHGPEGPIPQPDPPSVTEARAGHRRSHHA